MELLFILGNGFDINLGMKTGYQDFYDFYKEVKNEDPEIVAMKKSIETGRYTTWSDLEAGLGKYTMQLTDSIVFIKCLSDLKSALTRYLSIQSETKSFVSSYRKIRQDLDKPESYLDDKTANDYLRFLKEYLSPSEGAGISIVTFNYTDTIEDLLTTVAGLTIPILHIHGYLDNLVMGVNDVEQIANESYREDRIIKEEFIKPDYNTACLNDRNSSFEEMIESADVIVLFGLSMGETDRKWWRLIGDHMVSQGKRPAIIYFPYDQKKDTKLHPNYRLRWTEGYQKQLLTTLEIPQDQTKDVLNRIFIGINKDIFKLPQKIDVPKTKVQ